MSDSHSVSRHLRIRIDDYDATIRRFIRGYDQMLDAAVEAVLSVSPLERVVDLGAGTAALAERLLERHPDCTVELWDIDGDMLRQGAARLERFGGRVIARHRSFHQPLDGCDAAMASLALHHVRDLDQKTALYRSLATGLRPGGALVNADVTIDEDDELGRGEYRAWADHLVSCGIEEEQAWRHFEEWSDEDRYFSLAQELEALQAAGLEARCAWRQAPSTVIAARRPA